MELTPRHCALSPQSASQSTSVRVYMQTSRRVTGCWLFVFGSWSNPRLLNSPFPRPFDSFPLFPSESAQADFALLTEPISRVQPVPVQKVRRVEPTAARLLDGNDLNGSRSAGDHEPIIGMEDRAGSPGPFGKA